MSFRETDLLSLDVHTYNPYPFYQWLRDEAPLYWDAKQELWAVSRYDDVIFVSKNTQLFCSGDGVIPNLSKDLWPDEAMINLDGEEHTKQRQLVNKGFTSRRVKCMGEFAAGVIDELISKFESRGECDLVREFCSPLPMRIIGEMLGYPVDKMDEILSWADCFTHAGCGPEHVTDEVNAAFGAFADYHNELVEERKANPGDDLISIWLGAELNGQKLGEDKLMFEHNLLLVGGSETTRNAISAGMKALMENPDQMRWLIENCHNDELLSHAVEEMIRWATPFVRMRRTATQDVEMHGQTIKKGQQIIMIYPAANRDERAFSEPDKFDVKRQPEKPPLAFGYGKHFCLGASLARLETRMAVRALLQRLPDMKLKEGEVARPHPSCFIRGLENLPVTFTAKR